MSIDKYDLAEILRTNLTIGHHFYLDKHGQKHLVIRIEFATFASPITETDILIGQYKDVHDYSTDFTEQIL